MSKPSSLPWRSLALLLLSAVALPAAGLAGWTDRKEYDLVLQIRVESSPDKQLELLNQWQQQYPKSEMSQARRELFLAAYQAKGDTAKMFDVAREMVAEQPANLVGVYWCTLLAPEIKDTKPEILDVGEKSARQLLAQSDTYFAANQKPESVSAADWGKQKAAAGLLAQRTLGWAQWQRGNLPAAQKTFTEYLQQSPQSAEITSWLGYVLAAQNQPIPAAWQFSRAASIKEEGALPEVWRRQVEELADRLYAAYHGDLDGIDKLKSGAAAAAAPPADFKVESAAAIKQRKAEEELLRADPELGSWLGMYQRLSGADGEKYFLDSVKPNPLPKLRGTVVRCYPAVKPTEVVVGLNSATSEDVVLKLAAPLPFAADPGTEIHFEGTADTFVKDPFKLTVQTEAGKIVGWPETPPRRGGIPPGKKK